MPRYFFDIDNGEQCAIDESGQEMPDLEAARIEATCVLGDLVRGALPDGLAKDLVSTVRDAEGRHLFQATLSMRARWIKPQDRDGMA